MRQRVHGRVDAKLAVDCDASTKEEGTIAHIVSGAHELVDGNRDLRILVFLSLLLRARHLRYTSSCDGNCRWVRCWEGVVPK